jgi:peptidase M10/serralysin-like protein/hemolysin type calcium-binding protein
MATPIIYGTINNDNLDGTSGDDVFDLSQGGDDTATGEGGNDLFIMGAAFTAADKIDGGTGNDILRLNGDYTGAHAVVFAADTMVNVETLSFVAGHSYTMTLNDGNVGAGQSLLVNGATLGATDVLNFDGSGELDGTLTINGGAANDVLTAGAGNDTINLTFGGNDIANGGAGDDTFVLGAALNAADAIDGGSELDTVIVKGDYSGAHAVTFTDTTLTGIDYLVVRPGFNYDFTSADGNLGLFDVLTVDATALQSANWIHFDGSAELNGNFFFADGRGNDVFIGGAQSDGFSFDLGGSDTGQGGGGNDSFDACAHLDSTDQFDGGSGYDTMELTDEGGTYTGANALHLTAAMMANFEELDLDSGNYDITTVDANVAAGVQFTVDASFADRLSFDGSLESDGSFYFLDSIGNDVLKGGTQSDFLSFELGGSDTGQGGGGDDFLDACGKLDSTDQFDGGTGYDTMELTDEGGTYTGAHALHLTAAMMANFEELDLDPGNYDITTVDANVASGLTFTVDANSADQLTFDGSAELNGSFYFYDSFGDDVLTGGANADFFNLSFGGDDTANGGGGDDRFVFLSAFTASDQVDGGTGADTLRLEGDYTGGNAVVFADDTMVNVETLSLATGHSYDLTLADGNVLKGQTLLVNGFQLGAGDTLIFDGSAETDGNLRIAGGFGDDVLKGGAGNDFFNLTHGGSDTVTGGLGQDIINAGGNDTFVYNAVAESHSTTHDIIHSFNTLNDVFDLDVTVTGINTSVSGSVSSANFDGDLTSLLGDNMQSNHAILVNATGDFNGHVFLVVDANGDGHYSSADYIFDVTGASNLASLSTGNFI